MAVLILILFAALVLVGGVAVDMSQLNAQKAYAQGQADLAAQSAAAHLHDLDEARRVARETVQRNDQYDQPALQNSQIVFGRFTPEDGFEEQETGINAVRVEVEMPWRPLLWAPILSDDDYVVTRHAVALAGPPLVAFTLRNTLLSLDTGESPLFKALLGDTLGLDVEVLNSEQLLDTNIDINDLLGLVSLDTAVDVLTFEELLNVALSPRSVVELLADQGALPPASSGSGDIPDSAISLGDLLLLQGDLAQLYVGNVLPDISLNAADLLLATVILSHPDERLSIDLPITVGQLAEIHLETGVLRKPVTVVKQFDEDDLPYAEIEQVSVQLSAKVAGLLNLNLNVGVARAEATLVELNCQASEPDDPVATFLVTPAPASLGIDVSLLDEREIEGDDFGQTETETTDVAGTPTYVPVSYRQYKRGEPMPVPGKLELSGLTGSLSTVLQDLEADVANEKAERCGGLLGCLVGGLLGLIINALTGVLNELTGILAESALNGLVDSLLQLLGINVAQAEIVFHGDPCVGPGSTLVQ